MKGHTKSKWKKGARQFSPSFQNMETFNHCPMKYLMDAHIRKKRGHDNISDA